MKRPTRLPALLALLAVLALVAAACGSDTKVGSGVNLSETGGEEGQAAIVDPARTTTTVPPELEDQVAVSTTAPPTTVASQAQTTTTAAQNLILIQDDEQGHQFDPLIYQVPAGQPVTWRNVGTKDRQLAARDNSWASPMIPPGGEWTQTFGQKGVIDYYDTTRPYSNGRLQVY